MQNLITVYPEGAEVFYADRRTDKHEKIMSRFSQLCDRA